MLSLHSTDGSSCSTERQTQTVDSAHFISEAKILTVCVVDTNLKSSFVSKKRMRRCFSVIALANSFSIMFTELNLALLRTIINTKYCYYWRATASQDE